MSKPTASSPQATLADVERRIIAAARERDAAATPDAGARERSARK